MQRASSRKRRAMALGHGVDKGEVRQDGLAWSYARQKSEDGPELPLQSMGASGPCLHHLRP